LPRLAGSHFVRVKQQQLWGNSLRQFPKLLPAVTTSHNQMLVSIANSLNW